MYNPTDTFSSVSLDLTAFLYPFFSFGSELCQQSHHVVVFYCVFLTPTCFAGALYIQTALKDRKPRTVMTMPPSGVQAPVMA